MTGMMAQMEGSHMVHLETVTVAVKETADIVQVNAVAGEMAQRMLVVWNTAEYTWQVADTVADVMDN